MPHCKLEVRTANTSYNLQSSLILIFRSAQEIMKNNEQPFLKQWAGREGSVVIIEDGICVGGECVMCFFSGSFVLLTIP